MQSLFGGSSSKSNSQYTSTPINMQLPEFTGMAPGIASALSGIFGSGSGGGGSFFGLSPFQAGGVSSSSSQNPLVAGLTPDQMSLVQQAGQLGGGSNLTGAQGNINRLMDPNYANTVVGSPATQNAIASATNPMVSAFNNTTLPDLVGKFTASGQRVNAASNNPGKPGLEGFGKGSSAFDRASGVAQNNLLQNVGQTAGGISNAAYQTGVAQNAQAINQSMQMSQTQVKNLVDSLQAVALPQLIKQYGITQAVSLFQDQMKTILTALGQGVQGAQPAIAYNSSGSGSSTGSSGSGLLAGLGSAGTGVGNLLSAFGA